MKKVLSFLILMLVIAGCGQNQVESVVPPVPVDEPQKEIPTTMDELKEVQEPDLSLEQGLEDGWVRYSDPVLKISFIYPEAWGAIKAVEDKIGPTKGYGLLFANLNHAFLNAGDYQKDGDRGGSWLDELGKVTSKDQVSNFCQDKENSVEESCAPFVNDNGVEIIRHSFSIFNQPHEDNYLFYNANTPEFPGVVLSTSGVQLDASTDEQKMQFEKMVMSIAFTQ